ncbi:ferredoxin [Candidatus Vecturithrix granuli]|uniref:Ferredoxin n=1 Tax=Vecturithrix granuli TaxID=1499967 RepID=A0A081C8G8_VECG1|nr:ferredoxin [Candidatus Vecturithrix granuli]
MNITINGKSVQVEEGQTILEVAKDLNIGIPTLCFHSALEAYGGCRLCVVEARRGRWSKLVTSCNYEVWDGLEVLTNSERVHKSRKMTVELLLARCPEVEALQRLARAYKISEPRFPKEQDDCVLCGLCVRICQERMGVGAASFVGRGAEVRVDTPYSRGSEVCITCGACVSACPTQSIRLNSVFPQKLVPQKAEFELGLKERPTIYIPFTQALPNVPVIDRSNCVHFYNGACKTCQEICPAEAIDYTQEDEAVELDVGAVILTPGFCLYDAAQKPQYGYALYPNVVTSLQFERLLSASGPCMGEVRRPSDQRIPHRIAFIQCVGSRETEHNFCSSVCCMYAIKEAIIAKEHEKDVMCDIFYMDIRAYGKGFDAYYDRAKEIGIHFTPCRPSKIEEIHANHNLLITYIEEDGTCQRKEFEMAVLSAGFQPPEQVQELADKFGLALNQHGFAVTDPFDPVATSRKGVYVCGPFSEPKDIPETVVEASNASSRAMIDLAEVRGTQIVEHPLPPERDVRGEPPRIGVFVCHCGRNIGAYVDVPSIADYAKTLPHVVYSTDTLYTCSSDTQVFIKDAILEHHLNRIVVASCSPRTHEPLFQETIREVGLNPHLFEMANIRDQCSWVHMFEHDSATAKSKDLVRMAVAKSALTEPLISIPLDVTAKALVLGGGVGGMTAALGIANQGYEVFLVEKTANLGGNALKIEHDLYGNDVRKYLKALQNQVRTHPLITVFTNAQIAKVDGFIGNFVSTIETRNVMPKQALALQTQQTEVKHGVVIVATGGSEHAPTEYLYGTNSRVKTLLDLSEALATGEFTVPDTVVMIQCVGSREPDHNYCSRICCAGAIKNAIRMKKMNPDANIFILYRDIRTYGFREEYYGVARDLGINFIRYTLERKPGVTAENGNLTVSVYDAILDATLEISTDLLVLSSRIDPNPDNDHISQLLKVPLNSEKFFLEAHVKLRPVEFATDGVYVCGLAHYPKDIKETISQAMATAGRAATVLSKDKIEAAGKIAYVNAVRCSGCGACVTVCAYNAISLDNERQIAVINEALCKGCGACAATCRGSAIKLHGFEDEQILRMLNVL